VFRPAALLNVFPRDNLACVLKQKSKDLRWLVLQLELHALLSQFPRLGI
jgi:hypothetical protein